MKNILFKKGLVVGIIVLFVGVSVFTSVSSKNVSDSTDIKNSNNKLIEINVEICKIGGGEEYTVMLTKEKSDKLEFLIEDFKEKLDNSDSLEETRELHCDMIISLYELGVLQRDIDISNRDTILQQVYDIETIFPLIHNFMNSVNFRYMLPEMMNGDTNYFCYVSGNMTRTIKRFFHIGFGYEAHSWMINGGYTYYYPTGGWLYTDGWLGSIKWEGSFYGGFGPNMFVGNRHIGRDFCSIWYCRGIIGFRGTKIKIGTEHYYYQGSAYVVKVK